MRLVLFDVDDTLVHAGSLHSESFSYALRKVHGIDTEGMDFDRHGMLDKGIIRKMLEGYEGEIRYDDIYGFMADHYRRGIDQEEVKLLPGVKELLDKLKSDDVAIGLNTGNIREIAYAKLEKAGIADYFTLGGFGTESFDRVELARITVESTGRGFDHVFIVGDTMKDVAAAKDNGFRSIGVATGKTSYDELSAEADYVFHDLSDEKVAEVILGE